MGCALYIDTLKIPSLLSLTSQEHGIDIVQGLGTIDKIVNFYGKYLENQAEGYRKVWYKLFTAHDARKWPNVMLVSRFLFGLPSTSSTVKRVILTMKIERTNRHISLLSSTMDDLVEINAEGPELESFSPDRAVQLWWSDCT